MTAKEPHMADLPHSWRIARFDEFLKKVDRKLIISDGETYKCVGVRWYGMGAFVREELPGMDISRKQQWIIKTGDVVYNKLFAWKNSFAIADEAVDSCIVSDKFPTYEADLSLVDLRFLGYYFRMPKIGQQAQDLSKGAAAISKLTLNPPQFWDLTMPLPPLDEQRRLVTRIEALAAKIEEARGLRRLAVEEAEALYQAKRDQLFNDLQCERASIGDLFDLINGRAFKPTDWTLSGTRIVRIQNLKYPEALYNYYDKPVAEKFILHSGDVVFAWSGQIVSLGAHVWEQEDAILNQHIYNFKARTEMSPYFVREALNSLVDEMKTQVRGLEMFHIRKKELDRIKFPVLPLEEQRHIVAYLDGLQARVDALKALQSQTQAELDALLPSVLDQAFRGEL